MQRIPMVLALLMGLATTLMTTNASELTTIKINGLDGQPFDMTRLQGKTVLFVNVASRCGFTKQYDGLEKLYTTWKDRGFVVVGVPSNDFGGQEPGTAEEIAAFCRSTYAVDFPMTEKVAVKGEARHPLYAWLTRGRGEPKWNFHKYLVDKNGRVVGEFPSKTAPDSPELAAALEAALSAP
ncbi:MAG: glutathione peroxidase [Candidatus Methylacidiphilales bacterium]|nr:glutathione peroxidase [Candidatus Methylacidiphilales bacterium]